MAERGWRRNRGWHNESRTTGEETEGVSDKGETREKRNTIEREYEGRVSADLNVSRSSSHFVRRSCWRVKDCDSVCRRAVIQGITSDAWEVDSILHAGGYFHFARASDFCADLCMD